ncbi:hypothetical protein TSAR_008868, partial [Trichomalopsis sarcophagae]
IQRKQRSKITKITFSRHWSTGSIGKSLSRVLKEFSTAFCTSCSRPKTKLKILAQLFCAESSSDHFFGQAASTRDAESTMYVCFIFLFRCAHTRRQRKKKHRKKTATKKKKKYTYTRRENYAQTCPA